MFIGTETYLTKGQMDFFLCNVIHENNLCEIHKIDCVTESSRSNFREMIDHKSHFVSRARVSVERRG